MKQLFTKILSIFSILTNQTILRKPDFSEKKIFLQAKINEQNNLNKKKIYDFRDVEFSAFSQFGEDGIISWLSHQIPDIKKVFLEIGTQDYWESNTRYLLKSQMWKGYIIEGSKKDVEKIKMQKIYWQHDLNAICQFINDENINDIINKHIKEKYLGLLSIDIDGNDYWILKKIKIESDIVVLEYNPIFGDIHKISILYEKNFVSIKKHFSNLYFGCSINALIDLMEKKKLCISWNKCSGHECFFC